MHTHIAFSYLKYTVLHMAGKTPKGLEFRIGSTVAALSSVIGSFSVPQVRGMIAWGSPHLDYDGGHPSVDDAPKQDWVAVKGSGWKGCWVPFKASSTTNDLRPIGQGCDIVVLYAHGGGFVIGHPLQTIDFLRDIMKAVHDQSGLKVGILSIDYSEDKQI